MTIFDAMLFKNNWWILGKLDNCDQKILFKDNIIWIYILDSPIKITKKRSSIAKRLDSSSDEEPENGSPEPPKQGK